LSGSKLARLGAFALMAELAVAPGTVLLDFRRIAFALVGVGEINSNQFRTIQRRVSATKHSIQHAGNAGNQFHALRLSAGLRLDFKNFSNFLRVGESLTVNREAA